MIALANRIGKSVRHDISARPIFRAVPAFREALVAELRLLRAGEPASDRLRLAIHEAWQALNQVGRQLGYAMVQCDGSESHALQLAAMCAHNLAHDLAGGIAS